MPEQLARVSPFAGICLECKIPHNLIVMIKQNSRKASVDARLKEASETLTADASLSFRPKP